MESNQVRPSPPPASAPPSNGNMKAHPNNYKSQVNKHKPKPAGSKRKRNQFGGATRRKRRATRGRR